MPGGSRYWRRSWESHSLWIDVHQQAVGTRWGGGGGAQRQGGRRANAGTATDEGGGFVDRTQSQAGVLQFADAKRFVFGYFLS